MLTVCCAPGGGGGYKTFDKIIKPFPLVHSAVLGEVVCSPAPAVVVLPFAFVPPPILVPRSSRPASCTAKPPIKVLGVPSHNINNMQVPHASETGERQVEEQRQWGKGPQQQPQAHDGD
jgi:hypothetical protein